MTYINLDVNINVSEGATMNIIYTKSFDNSLKKLKKHKKEYDNFLKIVSIIENTRDFNELIHLPQVKMYGFERLKHDMNEYYSFNLNKKGGTIRLIVKPCINNTIEIYMIFISYDHYNDFNGVIYYE